MDVEGVIDFQITNTKMDGTTFTGKIDSAAGHVKLDIANSTITYVHN